MSGIALTLWSPYVLASVPLSIALGPLFTLPVQKYGPKVIQGASLCGAATFQLAVTISAFVSVGLMDNFTSNPKYKKWGTLVISNMIGYLAIRYATRCSINLTSALANAAFACIAVKLILLIAERRSFNQSSQEEDAEI